MPKKKKHQNGKRSIAKPHSVMLIGANLLYCTWGIVEKIPLAESQSTLLRLSIQNMLTLVSVNVMLFLDRIILAKHSIESLNAAVTASAICNIFMFGAIAIVGIGDVFIGQCFGAQKTQKIGEVLWQMVWFCLIVAVFFTAIGVFLPPYILPDYEPNSLSATYFEWQMCLGFLPVLVGALNSFFVGTKRFGFALVAVLIANSIRLFLEIPLVFGIEGFIDGLGIKGALIAAAISQVIHVFILAAVVIQKDNRARFGSLNCKLNPTLFIECMRLGFPQSIGSMLNYTAWGIVVTLLASAGQKHLMMYTIIDSVYSLLGFATEGLQKSVLSISANLIGRGQSSQMPKLLSSAIFMLAPILLLLAIPLLLFPNLIAHSFDVGVLTQKEVSLACLVIWIYFGFDGLSWILNGLLTAMGDTLFVNPINGMTSFVGAGATYVMTVTTHCQPEVTCWVSIIYGLINSALLLLCYQSRRRQVLALNTFDEAATRSSSKIIPMPFRKRQSANEAQGIIAPRFMRARRVNRIV